MKSCQKISELASLSLEKPLSWQQKMQLTLHLMLCRHCRAFDKNNKTLSTMLAKHRYADDSLFEEHSISDQER